MVKKFYKKTGMYNDWDQIKKLPEIDTLIDIGVGAKGTPDLYRRFKKANLILIDPLEESKKYAERLKNKRDLVFIKTAVGNKNSKNILINVPKETRNSSILKASPINWKCKVKKQVIQISKLDSILKDKNKLGKIGIKIDVEGYELEVIKGAKKTLNFVKFIIAEVRHNHESFNKVYKLKEFMKLMTKNKFVLTMILTAKPFIADLCFEPDKT